MTSSAVMLASILDLVRLSAEMMAMYERAQAGEQVTDAEWRDLKNQLRDADRRWEQA